MCRILADLLDPNGLHDEGAKYLCSFFDNVLHETVSDNTLQEASVYKEYPITNDRRIDIVISYRSGFIPIEVKINAGDQKSQCYDYYHFAKKRDPNAYIVYLSKYGNLPSDYSLVGANGEKLQESKIRCVSFSDDILRWLENIKVKSSTYMKPLIDQYIGAVEDFVNQENEEYKMKLADEIAKDSNSLRTSIEIANSVNRAKGSWMVKLFQEFEKQMNPLLGKYNLELETRSGWFSYTDQASEEFYAHNESTYPGLNYVIKPADLGNDLSLWFRIEIDNRLFGSLCVFDYAAKSDTGYEVGNQCDKISEELWMKLREYVVLPEKKEKDGWIILWKYLPTGSDSTHDGINTVPDFKKMNDAAIELADEDKRVAFVSKSIKAIEETIFSMIKRG